MRKASAFFLPRAEEDLKNVGRIETIAIFVGTVMRSLSKLT